MNPTVVFPEAREVAIEDRERPEPNADEVLIETDTSLVSTGTELTVLSGEYPEGSNWDDYAEYPFVAGYTNVGTVVEVGDAVPATDAAIEPGTRVATWTPHAAYVTAAAGDCVVVPEAIDDRQAALFAIAQIVMNGIRRGRVEWGETVVVYGLGILGQLAARLAHLADAETVVGIDLAEERLDYLPEVPGIVGVNPGERDPAEAVREATAGRGGNGGSAGVSDGRLADVVLEVTGSPDAIPGESFGFEVNGQPIYAKGANWIPTDGIPTRVERDDYERLLSDAVEANMNTIRVWGGGIYEREEFYETCDELGLLVWQDFMFVCALYPSDDQFLDTVAAEAEHQVRRLASHPSIALWCGNNENEEMLREWIGEEHEEYETYAADYDDLYLDTLGPIVEAFDPDDRAYWPSSPHSSSPDVLPNDEREGDVHFWDVWHSGDPFSAYLDAEPRFASEFGYQSFPSIETLSDVLESADMNPTAPLMEHHQRNPGGNGRILQRMVDHFRVPFDVGDFVYLSQVQQGLAIETAIEHWRRIKPHCGGTIYWQLNDMWQVASWSSIEYGGRWKALQHMTRRFYAPVLVSIAPVDEEGDPIGREEEPDAVQVWVTSDEDHALEGDVEITAESFDGEILAEETVAADVDAHESAVVATLDPAELGPGGEPIDPSDTILRAEYTGPRTRSPSTRCSTCTSASSSPRSTSTSASTAIGSPSPPMPPRSTSGWTPASSRATSLTTSSTSPPARSGR